MIIKEMLEMRLKKNNKVTVYGQGNIPLVLTKSYHITRTSHAPELEFEADCEDLTGFCKMTGLTLNPNTKN